MLQITPCMQGHDTHLPHHNARGRYTRVAPTVLQSTRHSMHPGRNYPRHVAPHPTASHCYHTAPQWLQPQSNSPHHRPHNTVGKQQHAQGMPAVKKFLGQLKRFCSQYQLHEREYVGQTHRSPPTLFTWNRCIRASRPRPYVYIDNAN